MTRRIKTKNPAEFSPREYREYYLNESGLHIGRSYNDEVTDDLKQTLRRYERVFHLYDYWLVRLIERSETKGKSGVSKPTAEVQKHIIEKMPSLLQPLEVEVEGVGAVPRGAKGALPIIDLTRDSQSEILAARQGIIATVEDILPYSDFSWMRFARPGIPIGEMVDNDSKALRVIKGIVNEALPKTISLQPVDMIPSMPADVALRG